MKTLSTLPEVAYAVINKPKFKNCQPRQSKQMNARTVYRDEYGSLVSDVACNWEEASRRIENGILEFGREIHTTQLYREKMQAVKKEWRLIDDYCLHTFLNYPASTSLYDGRMVKLVQPDVTLPDETRMEIARNDFPYNLTKDVEHYVLWSSKSHHFATYEEFARSQFPSNQYDILMFENLKANKSVKSVVHLQLLVRRKPSAYPEISVSPKM